MRLKYQASFFADLTAMAATSKNTVEVLTRLAATGNDLLPSIFQEMAAPNMRPTPRMRFASPTSGIDVLVGSGRLDVIKQPIGPEDDIGSINDFATLAQACMNAVLGTQATQIGVRLALITQSMADEVPATVLDTYFNKLFNAPDFYESNRATEWTFRVSAQQDLHFAQGHESVNSILKVDRIQGQMNYNEVIVQEFDRILTEIDINTVGTTTTTRFSPEDMHAFISSAAPLVQELDAAVKSKLET